jgi:hypothetical protein
VIATWCKPMPCVQANRGGCTVAPAKAAILPVGVTPSPEHEAVLVGVRAAHAALAKAKLGGALQLFARPKSSPRAEARFEAIQAYAELQRVLMAQGRLVPPTSLLAWGFSAAQIAEFDAIIASI